MYVEANRRVVLIYDVAPKVAEASRRSRMNSLKLFRPESLLIVKAISTILAHQKYINC